jgi:glutathione synthase
MALKVAVQMDHISSINIAGDSAFAMMLEAQRRGHELYHYTPDRLAMRGDDVFCALETCRGARREGQPLHARRKSALRHARHRRGADAPGPAVRSAYIAATHILEKIHPDTLVVNDPAEVRNAPEKLFVMEFADLMPPTLITRDKAEIDLFREGIRRYRHEAAVRPRRRGGVQDHRR